MDERIDKNLQKFLRFSFQTFKLFTDTFLSRVNPQEKGETVTRHAEIAIDS